MKKKKYKLQKKEMFFDYIDFTDEELNTAPSELTKVEKLQIIEQHKSITDEIFKKYE